MNENEIIAEIETLVHTNFTLYKERDLQWGELKKLTEFEFLLDDVIEMCVLDPIDKINLMRISQCISDKLRFDKIIFYYSSFHYFYNKIVYNRIYEDMSRMIYQMNIQINIVRIQIKHLMISGCSEDDYFFESRGRELVSALEILCNNGEKSNINYNPIIYLLLNYQQALLEYLESEDKHYFDSVYDLAKRCMNIIERFCLNFTQIQDATKTNVKLKMFIYNIYKTYQHLVENSTSGSWIGNITDIENSDVIINNVWAMINIYNLDENYFVEYFEKYLSDNKDVYNKLYEDSKMVYLRNCLRWMKLKKINKVRMMKLPCVNETFDKSWFYINDYINGYSNSSAVDITARDINIVEGYNDEILRGKIANIIINIDKHVINRESKKPHGVFEIADMELPIQRKSHMETYYLCIPVKSGVEILKKVTENIVYQVVRPFTYFGNKAIVIFISAKEVTEPFNNYVKRAKANLNFEIHVIAGKELVKLLKYNNQIEY
ncbi:hypothetical protein BLA28_19460 [Eisenbergiella tayi]|uniref:hypothetical protein n=1 Tax=Eisenbergiella tayi TaxID=1432052 RepID=UPI0008FD465A|nr:hypothetical protein [Eisenbergiella tayi]OIZ62585.1 hypothetical protein BLA28_19460 [Eisenbergiella tayi]